MRRPLIAAALALWITLIGAAPALAAEPVLAYLDAGTASLVMTAILAGFAAAALFVKRVWYWLKGLSPRKEEEPADINAEIEDTPSAQAAD